MWMYKGNEIYRLCLYWTAWNCECQLWMVLPLRVCVLCVFVCVCTRCYPCPTSLCLYKTLLWSFGFLFYLCPLVSCYLCQIDARVSQSRCSVAAMFIFSYVAYAPVDAEFCSVIVVFVVVAAVIPSSTLIERIFSLFLSLSDGNRKCFDFTISFYWLSIWSPEFLRDFFRFELDSMLAILHGIR